MTALASTPGALRLFGISIFARLPLPMLGIGLLVHAEHLTGSFAAAGLVSGSYALSLGVGGPLLGGLVDRRGQTAVLVASAAASAVLLGAIAALPQGIALPVPVLLAMAIGLATPPVGACLRALLPGLLPDPSTARVAYAFEASAIELTWILGPPLVLGLGAVYSSGAALAAAGGVMLIGTAAFVVAPASRAWRPAAGEPRQPGGSLRAPAMRTLVIVLVAVGVLFGAVEVAVAAASQALGSTSASGPLLGVWGVGSFVGGVLVTRLEWGADTAAGLLLMLGAMTVGHLLLIPASASAFALAAALFAGGAAIAPTYAGVYAMVDRAAPAGTVTEAFAWLATAVAVGAAGGAAVAGALAEGAGPEAAFALAAAAGGVAVVTTALRSATLPRLAPQLA